MDKNILIKLLKIIIVILKARCEQNSDEIERDKWGKHHENVSLLI